MHHGTTNCAQYLENYSYTSPGNGTQKAFYDDPSILFISLHRYQGGEWYPPGPDGAMDSCGVGAGLGKCVVLLVILSSFSNPDPATRNVNIPWPTAGMGDADYLYAFSRIVIPIAYEFAPELVISESKYGSTCFLPRQTLRVVSAGFDAAEGDPLGECDVTPAGFAHMTQMLTALAGGKVVAMLEVSDCLEESAI